MYELIKAGNRTYYIDCPTKIGIYLSDRGAYIIDAGNDKEAGRKVKKILSANGWELAGIIPTHSHADHIGGCAFLQQNSGCRVYMSGTEAEFARTTILEPAMLYGGNPPGGLHHKFLMAAPFDVTPTEDESFPKELELIALPGHSMNMTAVRTPDDILFIGDCVTSGSTIAKYKIPYIYDPAQYMLSLDKLDSLSAALFVLSHGETFVLPNEITEINRKCVRQICADILEMISSPASFDELLASLYDKYQLVMSLEQYALTGSTVRSFLSWLENENKAAYTVRDNKIVWYKTESNQ